MSDFAAVKDGQLVDQNNVYGSYGTNSASEASKSNKGSTLDKDSFLKLLITQMQYQDPLNPSTDTEFVAQLAQFSSLEQLQNLNGAFADTKAFSLIGQNVIVEDDDVPDGFATGVVEYVTKSASTTYIGVNGKRYSLDELISVQSELYVAQQKAPQIEKQSLEFNFDEEHDLEVELSLGVDDGEATAFAVVLNGETIPSEYLSFDEKKNLLTIDKRALHGVSAGSYKLGFVFNDPLTTTITDKVSVTVTGINPYLNVTGSGSDDGNADDAGTEADNTDSGDTATEGSGSE